MPKIPPTTPKETIKQILLDALRASYSHYCQIFSEISNYNRYKTDIGIEEIIDSILAEKGYIVTTTYMPINDEELDVEHYEFCITNKKYYAVIRLGIKQAETIFKKYNLK